MPPPLVFFILQLRDLVIVSFVIMVDYAVHPDDVLIGVVTAETGLVLVLGFIFRMGVVFGLGFFPD